ncbi:MAG TPA: hypothetical protein VEO94_07890 [Candidatus Dormibacteraeota bacterium]|nr:hypothetical protein [Candidatus Dormibacteraeota bacterium]
MGRDDKDIYQRFELVVRTPKRRILLDAFLPAPGTLESSVTTKEPPPLPVPEMTPEEMNLYRPRERDEDPAPEAKPRPKRKTAVKKKEAAMSLQDEVAEFMNRERPALAPDDDLTASIDSALDPKPGPDKKD